MSSADDTPADHFVLVLTNYPTLLQRTRRHQYPVTDQPQLEPPPQQENASVENPMDAHERILHEELRSQLLHIVCDYLSRTGRSYPIRIVFDLTDWDA